MKTLEISFNNQKKKRLDFYYFWDIGPSSWVALIFLRGYIHNFFVKRCFFSQRGIAPRNIVPMWPPHLSPFSTRLCNLPNKPCAPFRHKWHLLSVCLMKLNSFMVSSLPGHSECSRDLSIQQLPARRLDSGCWSLQPWLHESDQDDWS